MLIFLNILLKIFLIIILLNKIILNKITLEEAKNKSLIPFLDDFCEPTEFKYSDYWNEDCLSHYNKGYNCGEGLNTNTSGMKWYFDNENQLCLPFGYKGCGGNGNRFNSQSECYDNCNWLMIDADDFHFRCNYKNDVEFIGLCNEYSDDSNKIITDCPQCYECYHGFAAQCCNIENIKIYEKNTDKKPKCKNGKNPSWYYGISCDAEFCSEKEECIQLEIFAHCCPK